MQKSGRGYSSIHTIRGVLRPAFQMAVDDDVLLKNPFEFQLATIIINDSIRREAIPKKQESVSEVYKRRFSFFKVLRRYLHFI